MNYLSNSSSFWFKTGAIVSLFALVYANTMIQIFSVWTNRDDYSHGALIPFVALYLAWEERFRLRQLVISPNLSGGLIVLVLSGLLLLLGTIAGVTSIQQVSLLLAIPGLVWLLFGTAYLKQLTLPLVYLPLMVPVLDPLIGRIRWPFQLITAKCSGVLLKIMGIPVFQNVQYLELPNITLEVADICSGVNFFVSLIAVAVPLAFLTQRHWRPRLFILVFAIIIGVVANIVRVTLIGIFAFWGWSSVVHGPLHIFQGLFVSVFGFISLFVVGWVMAKRTDAANPPEKDLVSKPALAYDLKQFHKAWMTSVVLLLSIAAALYLYSPKPVPLSNELNTLPITIGQWKGTDSPVKEYPFRAPGADRELLRRYTNPASQSVTLYIGYFESQSQGKELITYKLSKLYKEEKELEVKIAERESISVNSTLISDKGRNTAFLYWYELNGKTVANSYSAKLLTSIDGLINRRTNGALVIVSSDIDGNDLSMAFDRQIEFVRNMFPTFSDLFVSKP